LIILSMREINTFNTFKSEDFSLHNRRNIDIEFKVTSFDITGNPFVHGKLGRMLDYSYHS